MARFSLAAAVLVGLAVFVTSDHGDPTSYHSATMPIAAPEPARLPLAFVANHGQWDTDARFVARRGSFIARLENTALWVQLQRPIDAPAPLTGTLRARVFDGVAVRFVFEDARADPILIGEDRLPGRYNYFQGPNRVDRHTEVPSYASVLYTGLYEGVDVRVREGDNLEYDLLLTPGANLDQVVIRCDGLEQLSITNDGRLAMRTSHGTLFQNAPTTWEEFPSGERRIVPCEFVLLDEQRYGFHVPGRDPAFALVIDPGLSWSTFLGGGAIETPHAMEVLESGDIIIAGGTSSPDFPTTPGAFDPIIDVGGGYISRLSADGSALLFSTIIEGDQGGGVDGIHIEPNGSIVFIGSNLDGFPVTPDAYDTTHEDTGMTDAVIGRLDPTGSRVLYGTYFGGTGIDVGVDIFADGTGPITFVGRSCVGSGFPTTPDAMDPTLDGQCDTFIARLDTNLTGSAQLTYSSYLGGKFDDRPFGLWPVDDGTFIVTGRTSSDDFPTTPGAFDTSYGGAPSGFAVRLSQDLKSFVYSTYLPLFDHYTTAGTGEITATGEWNGSPLAATLGAYDETPNGADDIIVARFDANMTSLTWLTYVGGGNQDNSVGISQDPEGNVIVLGQVSSVNFPTTPNAFDTTQSGFCQDGTISYISADGSQLLYSTYIGGLSSVCTQLRLAAADGVGNAIVAGRVASNFPTTVGAFQELHGGAIEDVSITRIPMTTVWQTVGAGLPGSAGTPSFTGSGPLCGGEPVELRLSRAKVNSSATLVIGLSELNAPFKGGTLVPDPDLVVAGLPVSATGNLVVGGTWPDGIPTGIQIYFQYWIQDRAGPAGLAASRGLVGTSTATLVGP